METEDEKIQRLVKEGIEKAKEDELIQRLSDKTSGKRFDSGKKTYPDDLPPTPKRIIGAPSKTLTTGETSPTETLIKTPFPVWNVIFIVTVITALVAMTSPTILDAVGGLLVPDNVIIKANTLNDKCTDAIRIYNDQNSNNNKSNANNYANNVNNICQEELDYLYANRKALDNGHPIKNWASNTIKILEENKDIHSGTSRGTSEVANSVVTGYQEQDTNDVRGNVTYSLWQNSIPYTIYEKNYYGERGMEYTGKLFMIIQYDRTSQEVIDYDLGLSETTQKAIDTPSNSPVIPTPLFPSEGYDDSFVKGLQKHGKPVLLKGDLYVFEFWNPNGTDTRGHEIVNTVGGFTSTKTYEVYGKYDENGNKIWRETTVWRFTIGDKLMTGRLVEGWKDNDITNPIQLTKLYECDDYYCSRLLFS